MASRAGKASAPKQGADKAVLDLFVRATLARRDIFRKRCGNDWEDATMDFLEHALRTRQYRRFDPSRGGMAQFVARWASVYARSWVRRRARRFSVRHSAKRLAQARAAVPLARSTRNSAGELTGEYAASVTGPSIFETVCARDSLPVVVGEVCGRLDAPEREVLSMLVRLDGDIGAVAIRLGWPRDAVHRAVCRIRRTAREAGLHKVALV